MQYLRLALPILAFLGLLDALYITYEELSGVIPPCLPGFSCASVLTSPWSHIGPIPLSVFGAGYYLTILVLGSLLFLEKKELRFLGQRFPVFSLLRVLTAIGFVFSLYLVFIMGVVIKGWCLYCLLSALTSSLLFLCVNTLAVLRKFSNAPPLYPLRLSIIALLYSQVVKPIAFLFDPEKVHLFFMQVGPLLSHLPLGPWLTRQLFSYSHDSLHKKIAGFSVQNPIGLSAGFDWDGNLVEMIGDVGFGFATIGTVTLQEYGGNPRPMLGRYPRSQALLVNKGFKSSGAKAVIQRLQTKQFSVPIGISIGSTNKIFSHRREQIQDIVGCFRLFEESSLRHSYYELNISCPNTKGGQPFTTPDALRELVVAVQKIGIQRPVLLKMPIDLSSEENRALLDEAAKHPVLTGLVIGNLTKDHDNPAVDGHDRELWRNQQGHLSGAPTRARSTQLIVLARQAYGKRFTIIGVGGIFSGDDAIEKIRAGADAVALITGMIYKGPAVIGQIAWSLAHDSVTGT